MASVECPGGEPSLAATASRLAGGNLYGDAFGDLVHVDSYNGNAAFLLGRGAPGTDGRIMYFSNCVDLIKPHYVPYEASENGGVDHVLSVNLNNEGFDEVLITRSRTWELIVLENTTGN